MERSDAICVFAITDGFGFVLFAWRFLRLKSVGCGFGCWVCDGGYSCLFGRDGKMD